MSTTFNRNPIFYEYEAGSGTITLGDEKVDVELTVTQNARGETKIEAVGEDVQADVFSVGMIEITGEVSRRGRSYKFTTTEPFAISRGYAGDFVAGEQMPKARYIFSVGKLELEEVGFTLSGACNVTFYLANFLFHGIDWTTYEDGGRSRDSFSCTFKDEIAEFRLYPHEYGAQKEIQDKLRKNAIEVYSTLQFEETSKTEAELLKIVDTIMWLGSFAKGSRVNWIACEICCAGKTRHLHYQTENMELSSAMPAISDNNPWDQDLKKFFDSTYSPFVVMKEKFKLDVFLSHYLASKKQEWLSMKYLVASIAMESISYNYWKDRNAGKKSFRERLSGMFEEHDYPSEDFEFVDIRNTVVHQGVAQNEQPATIKGLLELWNKMDRIFLSLLGFDAFYLDCRNNFDRISAKSERRSPEGRYPPLDT